MLRIEKAILCGLLVAAVAMYASNLSVFARQCDDIRQKVFRLHILANSDSAADQTLKIEVRNKILTDSASLFDVSGNKADVEAAVKKNLDKITAVAQQEVKAEGYSYKVNAQIVNMYFDTRTYGSVTLPAGKYDALRITIGAGAGHNWWCVLFPNLCIPSAEGSESVRDVLGDSETKIVGSYGNTGVAVKFKTVEMFEEAKNFVAGRLAGTNSKKKSAGVSSSQKQSTSSASAKTQKSAKTASQVSAAW